MSTKITFQELEFLKVENQKLKENLTKFVKTNEANKKIKEFMSEQELLLNNINEKIESIIAKTDDKIETPVLESADQSSINDESVTTTLENFINNPGLQHLAEIILLNLDYQTLELCKSVNDTFKQFLNATMNDSMFWLKRFIQRGLSKKNQEDWLEAIQMTRDGRLPANMKKYIVWYLKMYYKNQRVADFDVPTLWPQALLRNPRVLSPLAAENPTILVKKSHIMFSFKF